MTDKITIERETLAGMIYPPKPPPRLCGYIPDGSGVEWNAYDTMQMEAYARAAYADGFAAALAAQPAEPSMRPLPDHDNHHNALKCPYCNPRGLKFAEPVAQCPVKSYWLIECKNGFTGWYTGKRLDCRFFDTDPRKVYKFASKELAEDEISERGNSCMTATEHVDIAAQPAPAAVPPGYALVPIEPTPEMIDAGDVARHSVVTQARTSVIYRAMIAAAGDKT